MIFSNIIQAKEIFDFISNNSQCSIPKVRDHFKIPSSKPPTKEEHTLYRIINKLQTQGYIKKEKVKFIFPGGPHFNLFPTPKGKKEFSKLNIHNETSKVSSQDLKNNLMEFSEENRYILEELMDQILERFSTKGSADKTFLKEKIISIHKKQDEKLLQIFKIKFLK